MNKDLKIILIISSIIALFLAISIIIVKNNINKNTILVPTTTTTTTTKRLISPDWPYGIYVSESDLANVLTKSFSLYDNCQTGKEFNDNATVNDLSKTNIYHILFSFLYTYDKYTKTKIDDINFEYKLSQSELQSAYESLFSKSYVNSHPLDNSFTLLNGSFNLKNGEYIGNIPVDGCLTGKNPKYYIIDSKFENNTFYIDYALYYLENDYSSENIITKVYNSVNSADIICQEDDISNHLDELTKYRFKFVREVHNFVLDSITKI